MKKPHSPYEDERGLPPAQGRLRIDHRWIVSFEALTVIP
jgi:hypothetical protein